MAAFRHVPHRDLRQRWVGWDLRLFPALRGWGRLRWRHSHGQGSQPVGGMQDPPPPCPPVSGTACPGCLSCRHNHEVAPAPRPHGASPPPGRANPSLPPRHASPHGLPHRRSLHPPAPQIPQDRLEARDPGPRNPAGEIRFRNFIGIGVMPGPPSEHTGRAMCGGSIRLPARRERALGFQPRPLFAARFWGRSGDGSGTGITAGRQW